MTFYWLMFAAFALAALTSAPAIPQAVGPNAAYQEVRQRRSLKIIIAGLFLLVIIGLRYRVGGDWDNYELLLRTSQHQSFSELLHQRNEPAFAFLSWAAAQLDFGIWFVNLFCALPFVWGLAQLSREQPNPWLALVIATPFLIIVVGMGFTRQAAALGFFMAGLADYLRTGSLIRLVLLTLAGSLFHRTVLVLVPILVVAAGQSKVVSFALGVMACAFLYIFVVLNTQQFYDRGYLNGRYEAAGASVRVLMNFIPAAILLWNRDALYISRREKVVWKTLAILSVAAEGAIFVVSSVVVDRLAMYLIPLQLFVLGRLYLLASRDPMGRHMVPPRGTLTDGPLHTCRVWKRGDGYR
ncbi:MAG TPA: EpsG family protein [Sphingomicrobium sp.]|nr:EpsG family protein [Sphingomicrobium sp.]